MYSQKQKNTHTLAILRIRSRDIEGRRRNRSVAELEMWQEEEAEMVQRKERRGRDIEGSRNNLERTFTERGRGRFTIRVSCASALCHTMWNCNGLDHQVLSFQ